MSKTRTWAPEVDGWRHTLVYMPNTVDAPTLFSLDGRALQPSWVALPPDPRQPDGTQTYQAGIAIGSREAQLFFRRYGKTSGQRAVGVIGSVIVAALGDWEAAVRPGLVDLPEVDVWLEIEDRPVAELPG